MQTVIRPIAVPFPFDRNGKALPPAKAAPVNAADRVSSKKALTAALDRLDKNDDKRFRNRRNGDRISYRCFEVPARFAHPGGSICTTVVTTRNLSGSGTGLIVDRFLHTGTRVELALQRTVDGVQDLVIGKVAFCTHVGGSMHQVGVRFDAKVFPSLYVDMVIAG